MDHSPLEQTAAYELGEAPKWPTVVGTISIVWGSLSLLCAGCGVLSPVMTNMFVKSAEAQLGPMPDVMKPGAMQVALAALGLIWAILLLASGIMLTLRRPAARAMHLVYALGAIVLTLGATGYSLVVQLRIADWVANNPDSKWAQQQNPAIGFAILGVSVVLGLAWPVFCLVWFGAMGRRLPGDGERPA